MWCMAKSYRSTSIGDTTLDGLEWVVETTNYETREEFLRDCCLRVAEDIDKREEMEEVLADE